MYVCLFVSISLTADGSQRARLLISPTATLSSPSCLWSRRIFPSHDISLYLPGSRLMFFYRQPIRCKFRALLTLVNQSEWLNFTYSRSHAFRYGSQNKSSGFHKNRTHDFRTTINSVCMFVSVVITYGRMGIDRYGCQFCSWSAEQGKGFFSHVTVRG